VKSRSTEIIAEVYGKKSFIPLAVDEALNLFLKVDEKVGQS